MGSLTAFDEHSGYNFPWSPFGWSEYFVTADYHEFHHAGDADSTYGAVFIFWDSLCGTNKTYYDSKKKIKS